MFDNATCPDTCNKTPEDSTDVFCRCKRGDSRDDSDYDDEDVVIRKRRGLRFGERRDGRSRDGESGRQGGSRGNRNGDSDRQRDGRRGRGRKHERKEPCGILVDGSIQVFDNATCPDTCNKTREDSMEVFCQCRRGDFGDDSDSDSVDDNRNDADVNGNEGNDEDVVVIRKRRGLRFGERRDGRSRDGQSGRQGRSRGNGNGGNDRQRDGRRGRGRKHGRKEPCGILVDGSIQVFDNATCPDTCNKTLEDSTYVFCQCRGRDFGDDSDSDSADDNTNDADVNGNEGNDEGVVVIRKKRGLRFGERRDGRGRDAESGRQGVSRGNRYGDSDRQRGGRRGGRRGGKKEPCGILVDGSIQEFDNATCPGNCSKTFEGSTEVFCQCMKRRDSDDSNSETFEDFDSEDIFNDFDGFDRILLRTRRQTEHRGNRREGHRQREQGREDESSDNQKEMGTVEGEGQERRRDERRDRNGVGEVAPVGQEEVTREDRNGTAKSEDQRRQRGEGRDRNRASEGAQGDREFGETGRRDQVENGTMEGEEGQRRRGGRRRGPQNGSGRRNRDNDDENSNIPEIPDVPPPAPVLP